MYVCVCVCFLAVLVWLIWRIISCQLLQIQLACLYCLLCQAEGGSCLLLEGKSILHTANRVSNLFLSWSQTPRSLLNSLQWLQQQSHLQIPCFLKWIKLQMSTSCKERTSSSIPHPHNTTHPQTKTKYQAATWYIWQMWFQILITRRIKVSSSSWSNNNNNNNSIMQIIKEEKGEENDHQSGDLSCDHSKGERKKNPPWLNPMWGFPLPTSQGRIDHSSFTSSPISRPKTQDPRPISYLPRNNKNKIADLFFLVRFFS